MSAWMAQIGGAVGAAGLASLVLGDRRELRIGGLAAWAIGSGALTVYLAPHGHHRLLAAAAVVGVVLAAAGGWAVLRLPGRRSGSTTGAFEVISSVSATCSNAAG
jgi:hypothetical protein